MSKSYSKAQLETISICLVFFWLPKACQSQHLQLRDRETALPYVSYIWSKTKNTQKKTSGWWFQPIWNILVKMDHFPQVGMKIKNIRNHHLENMFHPHFSHGTASSPSTCFFFPRERSMDFDETGGRGEKRPRISTRNRFPSWEISSFEA